MAAKEGCVKEELQAQPDMERSTRLDAERITLEWKQKSTRRIDGGRSPIEHSPLFGGGQRDLFESANVEKTARFETKEEK